MSTDIDMIAYELDRLHQMLEDFTAIPNLREHVITATDFAVWEQLTTGIRGLQQIIRNVDSQVRGHGR